MPITWQHERDNVYRLEVRVAIVGPERWRSETLMFAAADLRKAPVEFFSEEAVADARAWLSVDQAGSSSPRQTNGGKDSTS